MKAPVLESLFNKYTGLKAYDFIKKRLRHRCFPVKFAKFLRTPFLHNTSGGCFWKYLMNSLFIAFENNEWCYFVVRIGSPASISFFCAFRFFLFLSFFRVFYIWILLLFGFEVSLSILKTKEWSCSWVQKWIFEE